MDARGLRALSTTQAYGDFNIGTLSQKVKPLLQDYAKTGVSRSPRCGFATRITTASSSRTKPA
jgi:hypothetical protein